MMNAQPKRKSRTMAGTPAKWVELGWRHARGDDVAGVGMGVADGW